MSSSYNPRDLPDERPASFDPKGRRVFIHPASVSGFYKRNRTLFYTSLVLIFMVLPWTKYAGEQTILLDLPHRKFVFFGNIFWAHDGPLIFFPLVIAMMALVFVTSIWGRLWCGWACPQTVFIDLIYRRIETWIEGNHMQRLKLDKEPLSLKKISKKTAKWFLFLLVSLHIAHSVTAYFVGAKELVWISTQSPYDNWGLFLFVQIFTLILLFDFGWFREQFCIIMCPYGRFQSVLMDQTSMAVMYDESRGEPRRAKGVENPGDCIDCYKCVAVCPTGIDIRKGQQMECVACTACIDACDEVMTKTKKPKGLIRYSSIEEMEGEPKKWSFRTFVYGGILVVLFAAMSFFLITRNEIEFKVIRALESPYKVTNKLVTNHFKIHLTNQAQSEVELSKISAEQEGLELIAPTLPLKVKPGEKVWIHFFTKFPIEFTLGTGTKRVEMVLPYSGNSEQRKNLQLNVDLLGPVKE